MYLILKKNHMKSSTDHINTHVKNITSMHLLVWRSVIIGKTHSDELLVLGSHHMEEHTRKPTELHLKISRYFLNDT